RRIGLACRVKVRSQALPEICERKSVRFGGCGSAEQCVEFAAYIAKFFLREGQQAFAQLRRANDFLHCAEQWLLRNRFANSDEAVQRVNNRAPPARALSNLKPSAVPL